MKNMPFVFLSFVIFLSAASAFANPVLCTDKELYRDLPRVAEDVITKCFKISLDKNSLDIHCTPYYDGHSPQPTPGVALCRIRFSSAGGVPYSLRDEETLVTVPNRNLILSVSERFPDEKECHITGNGHRIAAIDEYNNSQSPDYLCLMGD